jgi:Cu/Ag efflux protein CusF
MQRVARISRAAAAAVILAGISSASAMSVAGQDTPDKGNQDQGSRDQSSQGREMQDQSGRNQDPPTTVKAQLVTGTPTIQKIDKANRKLTLKGAQGKTFELKAGPDVNLDQLHVGDRVNASYYEEIAVAINKHVEGTPKVASTTVQRGGVTAQQSTLTARIVSVDTEKNTVGVRMPDGKTHTLKVDDPDLQTQLSKIKPGDNMDITYTQAVAVSVEPAKGPAKQPTK